MKRIMVLTDGHELHDVRLFDTETDLDMANAKAEEHTGGNLEWYEVLFLHPHHSNLIIADHARFRAWLQQIESTRLQFGVNPLDLSTYASRALAGEECPFALPEAQTLTPKP